MHLMFRPVASLSTREKIMRRFALLLVGLLALGTSRWSVADPPADLPATNPVIEDAAPQLPAPGEDRNLDRNLASPAADAIEAPMPNAEDIPADNRALREFRDQNAPRDDGRLPGTAGAGTNNWRYKQQNGHWWYWLPSNQWVFWNGSGWVQYTPQAYAAFYATQQPRAYGSYYRGGYDDGYTTYYNDGYNNGIYGGRRYWNGGNYGNRSFAPGWYGQGYGPWAYGYGGRGAAQGAIVGGAIGGAFGGQSGAAAGAGIGAAIGADDNRRTGDGRYYDGRGGDGNRGGDGRRGR
jgi:hypothetical protein